MGQIAENLARVREELAAACRRAGREPDEVALMAVGKVHPVEFMEEAFAAGQRLFGENRVQEFEAKAERVRALGDVEVHLIGPLQNNKTAKAAALFRAVDTIDEAKTAVRLGAAAAALGRVIPVLIEVKLSPEETKHGVDPSALTTLLDQVSVVAGIEVRGLMTVPPWSEDAETARPYFRRLRELRDELCVRFATVRELSMGMSNDYGVAIDEGATTVRVGTAIFGRRPAPDRA